MLVVLLLPLFFGATPLSATDPNVKFPVVETVDLFLDGSINPILVNLTKEFHFVLRLVWNLVWSSNNIIFDDFGTLVGGLVNGTQVLINGSNPDGVIRQIHEFGTVSYDIRIDTDSAGIKSNHLFSRLSFYKFIDPEFGLNVQRFPLQFLTQDDITATCDDFFVVVQGFRYIADEGGPAPDTAVNPFEYFNSWALWLISQPLTYFMIIIGFGVFWILIKRR